MDTPLDANASEMQPPHLGDTSLVPTLDVEVDTVSVVDGIWQDQPDNVAAFIEARLGDLARGRGNLYICLDVSGEVEGRGEVERALIEVVRDTYATSRGSIGFAMAEALRAANAHLYEMNRQVAREQRRMAGISAVVLRGNDLYIAQAGPAVVYVESSQKLTRYPAESDWFVEDSPLYSPQGTASAPLGVRREFASDLAHASVRAGDVFVLATRALTQLATTEELAIAFNERSAQEIASHLEEWGEDADFTALIAELTDPRAPVVIDEEESDGYGAHADTHIESLPIPLTLLVPLDESEPPLESEETLDAPTLDWDAPDADEPEAPSEEEAEPELEEPAAQPIYATAAAAVLNRPIFAAPPPARAETEAEIERRRAERAARRAAQKEGIARAIGAVTGTLLMILAAIGGIFGRIFGAVNWERVGKTTNRTLNLTVSGLLSFILLLVRLVLPGTPARTNILPRRATSDPLWVKALALVLPLLFIGLAGARYMQTVNSRDAQLNTLVSQADTIVKQAEVNPDKTEARKQLTDALKLVNEARAIRDTQKARAVLYTIQDQLNEIDGVAVLYFLPSVASLGNAQLRQIAATDQDVFMLDGASRVFRYVVNDVSGVSNPESGDGVILKTGDKVGNTTVGAIKLLVSAPRQDKANIVAVTDNAFLWYDLEAKQWSAQTMSDAKNWGDLRAIESFGGNVYLLDAKNNQIYRYTPTANGYSAQATPYFPENSTQDLSQAVDMAIDGDIWILNSDGTVLRYRGGTQIQFELGVLPTPLKTPVAIFTRPEVDSLYIADAGNQRIVEFDKNGKFVRQFEPYAEKSDVFQNLKDFTVNDAKRKLYFINTTAAFMANLPK